MTLRPAVLLACAVLTACTGQPTPIETATAPIAEPPATASSTTPTTVIPTEATATPDPVPFTEIGLDHAPTVSNKARAENRRALKAHRAGDYATARDGFTRALALSPDHDLARYNLACALSRLGELDRAHQELRMLLHRDLRRFQGRWRGERADADLEALRGSAHAAAIDALLPRLRAAYEQAHDLGIPAYMFHHSRRWFGMQGEDDDSIGEHGGTSGLVAGIYLHEAGRFVPLTRSGDVALLDLPRRRAFHVETSIWEGESHMIMHGDPELRLVSTSPDPTKNREARLTIEPKALGLGIDPDEDLIAVGFIIDLTLGWVGERVGIELHHWKDYDHDARVAFALGLDGTHERIERPVAFEGGLELLREGARFFAAPPEGLRLSKRTLEVDGRKAPIGLDRAYDQVFAAPEQPIAIVLDQRHGMRDHAALTFDNDTTVARVDLASGKAQRLVEGKGPGWVVLGPDGALYVETGGKTRRWATIDAPEGEPVMDGLRLTMPLDRPFCEGCG